MRLALVIALVLGGSPAIADDDELGVPGLDGDLRGDALAWEDATFYVEPWEGGLGVRFQTFGRGRREEAGRAIPVHIVSATRTFVEIELPEREGCSWRRLDVDPRIEALRLYVKREDLSPVLVKPFVESYSDGTSVRLAPGVPVMPTPSGLYVVSVRGDKLRLAIPHGSVGYIYTAGRVVEPAVPAGPLVRLDRYVPTARLDGEPFEVRAPWVASKPAKHGDTAHLTWSTRCIELVVSVPATSLRPAERPGRRLGGGGTGSARSPHYIPEGAPLATPGGHHAAVTATEIDLHGSVAGTWCFDARLTMHRLDDHGQIARTFKLCAPDEAVRRDATQPARPVTIDTSPTATPPDVAKPPAHAKRTAKGVWYRVLRAGKRGPKPTATSRVTVHYAGWTTDGKLFDASYTRGQPAEFPLTAVIPGWTDGVQLMSVGDKMRFWIPEELAYKGSQRAPQGMLVFDVELLEIK